MVVLTNSSNTAASQSTLGQMCSLIASGFVKSTNGKLLKLGQETVRILDFGEIWI